MDPWQQAVLLLFETMVDCRVFLVSIDDLFIVHVCKHRSEAKAESVLRCVCVALRAAMMTRKEEA